MVHEFHGRRVRPVHIVQCDHQRPASAEKCQRACHRSVQSETVAGGRPRTGVEASTRTRETTSGRSGSRIGPSPSPANASVKGWKGRCRSYSAARPRSTVTPRRRARRQNSVNSRVLPIPAAPVMSTKEGVPSASRSTTVSSSSSSAVRPTMRVSLPYGWGTLGDTLRVLSLPDSTAMSTTLIERLSGDRPDKRAGSAGQGEGERDGEAEDEAHYE